MPLRFAPASNRCKGRSRNTRKKNKAGQITGGRKFHLFYGLDKMCARRFCIFIIYHQIVLRKREMKMVAIKAMYCAESLMEFQNLLYQWEQ
jgi:hypothetical protein